MNKKNAALLIFTKSPVEGHVKTRLIPQWGTHGALLIYQDMIKATLEMAIQSDVEDIFIYTTPDCDSAFLQTCSTKYDLPVTHQMGDDLGARMHNAIVENLDAHSSVIIIGCDCPELRAEDIHTALAVLNNEKDVVIGPSEDGGYYLIGLNQPYPQLFTEIDWGTSQVMKQTRKRMAELDLDVTELARKWDVDRPEDVFRYMNSSQDGA